MGFPYDSQNPGFSEAKVQKNRSDSFKTIHGLDRANHGGSQGPREMWSPIRWDS